MLYFILFFVKILSTILTLFRELFGTQAILSVKKKTSTLILIRSLPVYWITSPLFLLYQNCVIWAVLARESMMQKTRRIVYLGLFR